MEEHNPWPKKSEVYSCIEWTQTYPEEVGQAANDSVNLRAESANSGLKWCMYTHRNHEEQSDDLALSPLLLSESLYQHSTTQLLPYARLYTIGGASR